MWQSLRDLLTRLRSRSPGATMVDAFIKDGSERICSAVSAQMLKTSTTQAQMRVMHSFLLGYMATLAEQFARSSGRPDASNAAGLMSLIAAQKFFGTDTENLFFEFNQFFEERDVGFGQGGAVALDDFIAVASGREASGLLAYFPSAAPANGA